MAGAVAGARALALVSLLLSGRLRRLVGLRPMSAASAGELARPDPLGATSKTRVGNPGPQNGDAATPRTSAKLREWHKAALWMLLLGYFVVGVFGRFPWKPDEPYSVSVRSPPH